MNPGEQAFATHEGQKKGAKTFHFKGLLQSTGWISPAFVEVNDEGIIQYISGEASEDGIPVEVVNGFALPGFQNAHSHAFQFAMAGMAEKHDSNPADGFRSWRQSMYACALTLDPGQMQAVAAMLYTEMLKRGYTHVVEFQYLHHDKNGKPYDRLAEMSVSLMAAAAVAGIKMTLVPVFYQKGGFNKTPEACQRRFIFDTVDQYFSLLDDCARVARNFTTLRMGFGVHSLRAANTSDILRIIKEGPAEIPFHMHAAGQLREVTDALSFLKQRPVEWLLNNLGLNERFHLIHCTHLSDNEVLLLANSGANVVLCPGTEANLGDGIFRLTDFVRSSGRWSIGTDSHTSLNPLEDLRWLDYTQRLTTHKRIPFRDGASALVKSAFFSGRNAMGLSAKNFFEVGQPLDAVVYDGDSPLLEMAGNERLLQALVYTADGTSVVGTIVNGIWVIRNLHHGEESAILKNFRETLGQISQQG